MEDTISDEERQDDEDVAGMYMHVHVLIHTLLLYSPSKWPWVIKVYGPKKGPAARL